MQTLLWLVAYLPNKSSKISIWDSAQQNCKKGCVPSDTLDQLHICTLIRATAWHRRNKWVLLQKNKQTLHFCTSRLLEKIDLLERERIYCQETNPWFLKNILKEHFKVQFLEELLPCQVYLFSLRLRKQSFTNDYLLPSVFNCHKLFWKLFFHNITWTPKLFIHQWGYQRSYNLIQQKCLLIVEWLFFV